MSLMCLEHHEGSPRQQSSQLTWWTATGDAVLTVEIGYRFGCRTTIHSLRGESKPPVIFFQELEVYRSVHSLLLRGSNCSAHSYFLSIQLQMLLHPLTIVTSSSPDSPSAPKTAGCPEVHSQFPINGGDKLFPIAQKQKAESWHSWCVSVQSV